MLARYLQSGSGWPLRTPYSHCLLSDVLNAFQVIIVNLKGTILHFYSHCSICHSFSQSAVLFYFLSLRHYTHSTTNGHPEPSSFLSPSRSYLACLYSLCLGVVSHLHSSVYIVHSFALGPGFRIYLLFLASVSTK